MPAPNRIQRGFTAMLILAAILIQGCSAMPQIVYHRDPLTAMEHVSLGASYDAQGLHDAAAQQYKAALRLDKDNIPALMASGNAAFEHQKWGKAKGFYLRVLRLMPLNAGANNNMAMIYLATRTHLDNAETYAQAALDQGGPLKPYVLDTLAGIYIEQGRFSEARTELNQAIAAAPANDKALTEQLAKTREKLPQALR